ncbi:GNAT family N-acetyltransferase [Salinivibrio sharmensis]|uniref:GNAT family N-acetyltransferase n=1 Tax=Salinivibrio sharmensis TaxID=390883 RepID=A0ABX3KH79_9GAMM|nr:GNAT family N-acetyltransferase [Salinivibrio sharmensis]OOE88382.1 GNAT family N-acetyltransferase [Salinivibrio sharmensis]
MEWQQATFDALDTRTLFKLMKLRVDVFVVEQACAYPELDTHDIAPDTVHLMGWLNGELAAYARILAPGASYPGSSIGRVIIAPAHRSGQWGHQLIRQAVQVCQQHWPEQNIEIGAQAHLQRFYQKHDFVAFSDVYLEDGIPHIDMRLAVSETSAV